jgi:hypothetical protein
MNERLFQPRGLDLLILALVCLLTVSSQRAHAQVAFGSMVGNVTDPTGAGISGATVKIILVQTNDARTVLTNDTGGYTISTVVPGTYKGEVTQEDFASLLARRSGVDSYRSAKFLAVP